MKLSLLHRPGIRASNMPFCTVYLTFVSDPFIHMERANKTYGWVITVKELRETVPNLFRYVSGWKRKNGIKSQGMWEMFLEKPDDLDKIGKVDKDGPGTIPRPGIGAESMEGEVYNMCHFWSNFEIARFDFFRSTQYEDFFKTLEESGGFWQERVTQPLDAPFTFGSTIISSKTISKTLRDVQANIIAFFIVGRCTSSFLSCGYSIKQEGRALLQRFWLST